MIAVILIGGLGARLRAFTRQTPKPLLPVLNKPFLRYQLEHLRAAGVRETVLCTSYRSEAFKREIARGGHGLKIRFVHEKTPLGTGGALKNAEPFLKGPGPVLVMNGDVLNMIDLRRYASFHKKNRSELSLAVTKVSDPTAYGLVKLDVGGQVLSFLEKPSADEVETNTINAGAYLINPGLLALIPSTRPSSLERDLFPKLIREERRVFGYHTTSYWIDIGTAERYLQVHLDMLAGRTSVKPKNLKPTLDGGRALIGEGATLSPTARLSGLVCVGPRCKVGRGALLKDCVLMAGARVEDGARVEHCVIGPRCVVGAQAVLSRVTALAGGSRVEAFSAL